MEQAALADVVGLGALAHLAGLDKGHDVPRLARPVGEPADEHGGLLPAKVPAERRVVTFLEDSRPQAPPVRHAEPVRLGLPPAVEQTTAE